jgi:nitroreductase
MNTVETIKKRHSVRTYTGKPLSDEYIAQIKEYISQLKTPFDMKARIELVNVISNGAPVKLGTYGLVKGASNYLVLICEKDPFSETAGAYMFEQVILFCTSLDLGTCWIGGTFSRGDFKKQISLESNEQIRVISPVGYASGQKRFIEKYIVQADKKHASRKPFEELFFDEDFSNPLTESTAGQFFTPLEMVRLAPSANNKQEWRVLLDEGYLHFYKKPYPMFDTIDMGIALCHFELTCKELGIEGQFEQLKNYPTNDKLKYVISWVIR